MTAKLALALMPVIALVLALFSYARIERETELFDFDMRRDHAALAHAVGLGAQAAAARAGPQEAVRLIEAANSERDDVEILWVQDSTPSPGSDARSELHSVVVPGGVGQPGTLVTTVPLRLAPDLTGRVELEESLARRSAYVEQSLLRALAMTGTLVVLCAGMIYAAVWWLMGRRMRRIIERIHAIGEGDLAGRLDIETQDEIGVFARELDAMCGELAEIQEHARRSTEARLATLEQLRHADRLSTVGKLASGIAHELGTPLNVVAARAKMIRQETDLDEEVAEDARIISEQSDRMTRIIRQLLDFARVGRLHREPTPLTPLIRQTLEFLEPLARKEGVTLVTRAPEEVVADVDASQIQQALTNLVMNAIQAQPGGGRVTVALRGGSPSDESAEHGMATVIVSDEGEGMAADVRERVFEPFFTTKDVGQGTGLGLSVAHGIIVEHGGRVELESEPGRGSCFTLHLPVAIP